MIELTQLTGVWGTCSCAYRVFDVDDLLTNTVGTMIGSGLALILPRRHRGMARVVGAGQPRPVTRGRRALVMVCDWLGFTVVVTGMSVLVQLLLSVTGNEALIDDGRLASTVGGVLALVVWLVVVLTTGQTIGDLAVVSVVLLFLTTGGRGLPGLLSGQQLVDARQPRMRVRSISADDHRRW